MVRHLAPLFYEARTAQPRAHLTPVFAPGVNPVHPGVYRVWVHGRSFTWLYAAWTGTRWGTAASTVGAAARAVAHSGQWYGLGHHYPWRGLREENP